MLSALSPAQTHEPLSSYLEPTGVRMAAPARLNPMHGHIGPDSLAQLGGRHQRQQSEAGSGSWHDESYSMEGHGMAVHGLHIASMQQHQQGSTASLASTQGQEHHDSEQQAQRQPHQHLQEQQEQQQQRQEGESEPRLPPSSMESPSTHAPHPMRATFPTATHGRPLPTQAYATAPSTPLTKAAPHIGVGAATAPSSPYPYTSASAAPSSPAPYTMAALPPLQPLTELLPSAFATAALNSPSNNTSIPPPASTSTPAPDPMALTSLPPPAQRPSSASLPNPSAMGRFASLDTTLTLLADAASPEPSPNSPLPIPPATSAPGPSNRPLASHASITTLDPNASDRTLPSSSSIAPGSRSTWGEGQSSSPWGEALAQARQEQAMKRRSVSLQGPAGRPKVQPFKPPQSLLDWMQGLPAQARAQQQALLKEVETDHLNHQRLMLRHALHGHQDLSKASKYDMFVYGVPTYNDHVQLTLDRRRLHLDRLAGQSEQGSPLPLIEAMEKSGPVQGMWAVPEHRPYTADPITGAHAQRTSAPAAPTAAAAAAAGGADAVALALQPELLRHLSLGSAQGLLQAREQQLQQRGNRAQQSDTIATGRRSASSSGGVGAASTPSVQGLHEEEEEEDEGQKEGRLQQQLHEAGLIGPELSFTANLAIGSQDAVGPWGQEGVGKVLSLSSGGPRGHTPSKDSTTRGRSQTSADSQDSRTARSGSVGGWVGGVGGSAPSVSQGVEVRPRSASDQLPQVLPSPSRTLLPSISNSSASTASSISLAHGVAPSPTGAPRNPTLTPHYAQATRSRQAAQPHSRPHTPTQAAAGPAPRAHVTTLQLQPPTSPLLHVDYAAFAPALGGGRSAWSASGAVGFGSVAAASPSAVGLKGSALRTTPPPGHYAQQLLNLPSAAVPQRPAPQPGTASARNAPGRSGSASVIRPAAASEPPPAAAAAAAGEASGTQQGAQGVSRPVTKLGFGTSQQRPLVPLLPK